MRASISTAYSTARSAVAGGLVALTAAGATSCTIGTQQEIEMGRQYAAEINRQLPLVDDAQVVRFVNSLGNRIASQGQRNLEYRFYVVNTDVVNAFAVPGGFVYINRGLIERTDNLSELAGVVAHEIAHVELRHGVEQMERMQTANLGLMAAYVLLGRPPTGVEETALQVGGSLYFAQHGRQAEREADASAVRMLPATGIDPQGIVTFFQKLLHERQRQPSAVEQWFSTHPLTEERIDETRALIQQLPASALRNTQTTSGEYRSMKSRLANYPAPPAEFRARR